MARRDLCRGMVKTGMLAIAGGIILLGVQMLSPGSASSASHDSEVHLRLVDRLDRPEDGYCLDIPGPPQNLFLQLPLFAHNCSPSLKIDTAVEFTSEGFIKFPRVDRCVTVAGVKTALPGSSIMLSECNPSNFVIDISVRQRFTHRDDPPSLASSPVTELCPLGHRSAESPGQIRTSIELTRPLLSSANFVNAANSKGQFQNQGHTIEFVVSCQLNLIPDRNCGNGTFSPLVRLYFSCWQSAGGIRCPLAYGVQPHAQPKAPHRVRVHDSASSSGSTGDHARSPRSP